MRFPSDDEDDFALIAQQAEREFLCSGPRRWPEPPFYHYTTEVGLKGILETEAIWATEYRKLSDSGELTRGEQAVQDELDAVVRESSDSTGLGWMCRQIHERRKGHRLIDIPDMGLYVASFSSQGDLYGQWCRYADDGQGYAIGFNALPLPPRVPAPPEKLAWDLAVDFGPCDYDVDACRAHVRAVVLFIADGVEKYVKTYCTSPEQVVEITHQGVSAALTRVTTMVPFLKDPAFIDEKEWRLIVLGATPAQRTRPTRYGEAPYVEMPLRGDEPMKLHEIVAGPRSPKDLDFLRSTLDRCGYGHVKITRSGIPYR